MALTRKMLKGMGIEDEKIDLIIEAHAETVDGLKDDLKTVKEKAEKFEEVQKELDALKAKGEDGFKEKYEKEHKEFEEYKSSVTAEKTKAAKESAAKSYFESKSITGSNLEIAMRGAREEIDALELEDGKIKDAKSLDNLISGTYAGLVVKTGKQGASTPNPPSNNGGGKMTKDEIMSIKDDHARQVAIAQNHDLFGY